MVIIKDKFALEKMALAGNLLSDLFSIIPFVLQEGMTTFELDKILEEELSKRGLVSQAMGYHGYKHATCISLNDEVVMQHVYR